ncbi:MAG: DUF3078 domain-containing protein [Dysgonamonadaceae bacterium]|jgi:hypothetical protein|nr:DUF3078 domain-containing protein [Dysgonamonadaceae bacterium]
MIEKKILSIRSVFVILFASISINVFPQDNDSIAEQDTIESAEIITIGSEGNENPVVKHEVDTVTVEAVPEINVEEKIIYSDSLQITKPIDLTKLKKLLRQYYSPPIKLEFEYPDTVVFPSLDLPFVYFRDRTPDTLYMPETSVNNLFIPVEKRLENNNFFRDKTGKNKIDRNAYLYIVDNHPEYIKYSINDLSGPVEKAIEIEPSNLNNVFDIEYDLNSFLDRKEGYKPKQKYWLWKGNHYISFSQSDNSGNWTDTTRTKKEKGIGTINLISVQGITGKYKKNRVEINHNMEWRLSIANSMSDSLRSLKILEDRLRSYTDFGIAAVKHWNYSTTLEITTPLMNSYRENTMDTVSAFLSPVKITYGLGMQYNITKEYTQVRGKKITFVAFINPLACQYIYIKSHLINPAQHGIKDPKGDRNLSLFDFGSTITSTMKFNFNKYVTLDSRLKYFTNYSKTYFESENTLNMPVNRYISMRLYFFLTYDDTRVWNSQFGHFSINETLGLTFNVTW